MASEVETKGEMEENGCLEEKEVILVLGVNRPERSDFYIVDLKANQLLTTPINALIGGRGELVRVGKYLYNVGGGRTSVDEDCDIDLHTSCVELSIPHLHSQLQDDDDDDGDGVLESGPKLNKWKEAPQMKYARKDHCCASLGGKLYAMGGNAAEVSVGEVLDPQLGYWKELPPPPSIPLQPYCVDSPVIPDEKNDRLLVHFKMFNSLYAYYPSTATWDCIDEHFFCFWRYCTTVLVDDVLYYHIEEASNPMRAYDLSSKAWLNIVYSWSSDCPSITIRCSRFQGMVHLGNDMLCLCEFRPCFERRRFDTKIRFVKFRVHRTSPGEVLLTDDSVRVFSFDGYFSARKFIRL